MELNVAALASDLAMQAAHLPSHQHGEAFERIINIHLGRSDTSLPSNRADRQRALLTRAVDHIRHMTQCVFRIQLCKDLALSIEHYTTNAELDVAGEVLDLPRSGRDYETYQRALMNLARAL